MTRPSEVVKRSISLSRVVSGWADILSESKGFGTNFSAYIADLIRRDKEREDELRTLSQQGMDGTAPREMAESEIERELRRAVKKRRSGGGK